MRPKKNKRGATPITAAPPQSGQCRIIAGKWRGRKLPVLDVEGLRPSSDRIRETLFNWLAPSIRNTICLDCFAGSGALGFEALSRGAARLVMIEQSRTLCEQLKANRELLQADNTEIICASLPSHTPIDLPPCNIIFLDPPFRHNLLPLCYNWLIEHELIAENALIYIECEKELDDLELPEGWEILKQKVAGQVAYYLIQV